LDGRNRNYFIQTVFREADVHIASAVPNQNPNSAIAPTRYNRFVQMNPFDGKLAKHDLKLRRGGLQALQVNVGRKCNQTCRHCHVDAAPWRKEMIDKATAHRIGGWIQKHRPAIVDLTGGAPEISRSFCYLVEVSREVGCHVIDRNNLTIIEEPGFAFLPAYLAHHEVEVIASLPCYSAENVEGSVARACSRKASRDYASSMRSATARACR